MALPPSPLGPARPAARPPHARTPAADGAATPPAGLSVAVAVGDPAAGHALNAALLRLGHRPGVVAAADRLADLCRVARPDLLLLDGTAAAPDGLAVPVVLVTGGPNPVSLDGATVVGHVAATATDSDLELALGLAVRSAAQTAALRAEAAALRQQLDDRKVIERAKGAVMRRGRQPEAEAFARLRKRASDQNLKLVEVAHAVVAAEEVFAQLERCG